MIQSQLTARVDSSPLPSPEHNGGANGSSRGHRQSALPKLSSIQVLRGIAASVVVFHHFAMLVENYGHRTSWLSRTGIAGLGAAGVDIFFAISGFIMVYTTARKTGFEDAWAFLKKRAIRIYPLYWLWTTVLLIVWCLGIFPTFHTHSVWFFLGSYLLIPVYNATNFHPFLDQGWTLSFEMLFYCAFTLAIGFRLRHSIIRFSIVFFAALFAVSLILPQGSGMKYLFSSTLLLEFLFGVIAAKLFLRTLQGPARLAGSWPPVCLVILGCALLFGTRTVQVTDLWRFCFWGIPAALIVLGFALWKDWNPGSLLVYLGDASYSVYLVHVFFLKPFGLAISRFHFLQELPPDLAIIGMSLLTIFLSAVSFRLVEQPLASLWRSQPSGAGISGYLSRQFAAKKVLPQELGL